MNTWNSFNIDRNEYMLRINTANATPTVLTNNFSAVNGAVNQVAVPAASGFAFIAEVVGLSGSTVFRQRIKGTIKTTGGTTALVGSNVTSDKWADAGASTWAATATADNTNKCLAITVTGQAGTTIKWFALITTIEIS
jgi:hypothetical protein